MTAKEISLTTNQFSELKELISESEHRLKNRITTLIEQIGYGLYEREEVIAVAFLSIISGQNTFLFGPPGTAKSLISRRLSAAFNHPAYYEHLMSRFTTPEEVFGPVSIKELKEDRYIRKTAGYLPTADFAFLDEIWKSSPAILNTLLTLINEHIFKNGEVVENVPLKGLIAASNEVPAVNQGLEALYDRFVVRLVVPPVNEIANFKALISSKPSESKPKVDDRLLIKYEELSRWKDEIYDVSISDSCMQVIQLIRQELVDRFEELGVYVSDRRWQRAALFMKASAFFNGRKITNHSDSILLKHCLWTTPENKDLVYGLVLGAIKSSGIASKINVSDLDLKKEALDKEIEKELFYNHDVYKTFKLGGNKQFFKCFAVFKDNWGYETKSFECFIPYSEYKSQTEHEPVSASGNKLGKLRVTFDSQGSCLIKYKDSNYSKATFTYTPEVLFHKGDRKEDVNERLVKSIIGSIGDLKALLRKMLKATEDEFFQYQHYLDSPFVNESDTGVAVAGIKDQIDQIQLRLKDCERLESLCQK